MLVLRLGCSAHMAKFPSVVSMTLRFSPPQSILLGVSDVSGGTGPTRGVEASSLDGDALNGAGGGQPPAPPSGDAAFQSSFRGGKAKFSALRSLIRLKDRVAPVVLNRSSRKPSRIPKPAHRTKN